MRITLDTSKTLHGSRAMMPEYHDDRNAILTCPICGKEFTINCALKDYCYQYRGKFFCRYNHVQEYIRKHSKPSVKRINFSSKGWEYDKDWCRRRIAYCRERIIEYEERRESTSGRLRANALTQINRWSNRLIEAQDHLKALE